jgi:hypothetical protein
MDYTQTDWTLISQEQYIRRVNPAISTRIIKSSNKNYLVASNISEADITKIFLITNTDKNNNYLYLENFKVFLDKAHNPVNIPGLEAIILDIVRKADITSFINGSKVSFPFSRNLFNGSTINQFIDNYTRLLPNAPNTFGRVKTYKIVLNPDDPTDAQNSDSTNNNSNTTTTPTTQNSGSSNNSDGTTIVGGTIGGAGAAVSSVLLALHTGGGGGTPEFGFQDKIPVGDRWVSTKDMSDDQLIELAKEQYYEQTEEDRLARDNAVKARVELQRRDEAKAKNLRDEQNRVRAEQYEENMENRGNAAEAEAEAGETAETGTADSVIDSTLGVAGEDTGVTRAAETAVTIGEAEGAEAAAATAAEGTAEGAAEGAVVAAEIASDFLLMF